MKPKARDVGYDNFQTESKYSDVIDSLMVISFVFFEGHYLTCKLHCWNDNNLKKMPMKKVVRSPPHTTVNEIIET